MFIPIPILLSNTQVAMALSVLQTRLSNAAKVNTSHLYSKPFRTGIPVLQSLLLIFAAVIFGFAIAGRYPDEHSHP